MKVSYRWLSEYVDLSGYTAEDLAEKLTRSGIEVDGVEKLNKGVNGVVVGYVKEKQKHPDADKLNVCTVDVGGEQDLQIVCGAANVAAGQKVPVAVIGSVLPGDFKIKRAKLRGVESQGMICSAKELEINDRYMPKEIQQGIYVLPPETPVGESILSVLGLDDEILDLDLTPNRSDCLSMIGVAYEIAAILGRDVKLPDPQDGLAVTGEQAADKIKLSVEDEAACPYISAGFAEGLTIAPSPLWMQLRLMAAGVRPISNVVDITNYVMLEYGQPLHAYDADKLQSGVLGVRTAQLGEKLVTLDDVERTLEPHMLVITDGRAPIGLAGVMGGASTEVSAETTRIMLEAAKFSGASVRRTSRQLALRSEASQRFEKEVNADAVTDALNRALSLMCLYAGGKAAQGYAESAPRKAEPIKVTLSLEKVNAHLGTELTADQVANIFTKLVFPFTTEGTGSNTVYTVYAPGRRGDITGGVDLIEEIARLNGYDEIPTTLMSGVTTPGSLSAEQKIRRRLRSMLIDNGLSEVISYSLVHPDANKEFPGAYKEANPIPLAMPMSEEHSVLRTSLVPQLLETVQYNRNRNMGDVALFEIGKAYVSMEKAISEQPTERLLLSVILSGNRTGMHWAAKPEKFDFYDLKGIFEKVAAVLGLPATVYRAAAPAGYHPGRTAEIVLPVDGKQVPVGFLGQLHPDLQREKSLGDTFVFEVELDTLSQYADFAVTYKPIPRHPVISRDIAVVVDASVPVGEMLAKVKETAGELLEHADIFDIYTGERLGENRKSAALSLIYRHPERTLTDEEVTELHGKVVTALEQTFAAELRK
ncbi:phenylalanine--tRNA ligase subunit beta [Gorillibacterium massiliense]|uniref:phenylalanine--tRNA ligase subunit beta n=1 Tax=Gorillibacterium massiliense TaxID=1280390 RepID=UPI0004B61A33|nr:phenylalanine--tRNA ligase subunit beta [Gorillibacterium massiliense]